MSVPLHIAHPYLILDACSMINLYASARMGDILLSIPRTVTVAAYVRAHEVQSVYAADGSGSREAIDLTPYIDGGLLNVVDIETPVEKTNYLDFAAELGDDGEAITGAIAAERGWAIGTDDKAAIHFFIKRCPHIQIVSSLELVKHWADTTHVPADEVGTTLRTIRIRGRYQPHRWHPLYTWWQEVYTQ